ncbi:MAG: folylpolyglutamate synthase/dihydrofolate synthase family protein [Candidatus Omnitrophota bacterium]
MDYGKALSYIDSFINFERIPQYNYASSFKLERILAFLCELGNPHEGLNSIHIAGSKGKGSTSSITAYILRESGYKTGLFTSPHLMDTRERIRVLNKDAGHRTRDIGKFEGMIGEDEFIALIEKIKPAAERFRDSEILGKLSFFEILTACAFLYFKDKEADIAIFETGLGGRLDATNVIQPLVCGITNISMEHTDKLGNTLSAIAMEKAGIIKDQGVVVVAHQEKEAIDVIRKVSEEKGASLYEVGRDITYSIIESSEKGEIFNLNGPGYIYNDLELNLIGMHQAENAGLAIAITRALPADRYNIDEESIRSGLKKVLWPGRLQVVRKEPYILLDGAQNTASIETVLSSIKEIFNYNRLICVFGISKDKDIKGVAEKLNNACDIIILTRSKNPRAIEPAFLREYFPCSRPGLEHGKYLEEAMQKALEIANKQDLILVTGSLFLVGEAIESYE